MSGTPNADAIADRLPWEEELLQAEGLDSALIGVADVFTKEGGMETVLAYDRDLCISSFMRDGMSREEAIEYFDFNVAGAYMGPKTPVYISRVIDE